MHALVWRRLVYIIFTLKNTNSVHLLTISDVLVTCVLNSYVTRRPIQPMLSGADWRRGRVVDFGPRGPGFNPQPGHLSLWP